MNYHINLFYSDEDGGWIGDIPDLPYCSSFGDSPEVALAEVLVARDVWLEAAQAEGRHIPEPSYRPVTAS